MKFIKNCVKLNKYNDYPNSEAEENLDLRSKSGSNKNIETNDLEMTYILQPKDQDVFTAEHSERLTDSNTCYSHYGAPLYKLETINSRKEKFLNWFTLCLWNCSGGCQQLPPRD